MLQKFAMVKYGVFVAKICKHALCASAVRDIWWSPLARQLLPPWWMLRQLGIIFGVSRHSRNARQRLETERMWILGHF